jgi:methyl acetate hydrolase
MIQTAQVDERLRAAVERGDVPGVVAMAATRGEVIYQGAFGPRALPDGSAMTIDTVFWIASMTKAITSMAAMQLVEKGKLTLDKPIADVLPELSAPQVLDGFSPSGEPKLRPAKKPINLRHLLTHTSGFVYDIWNPAMGRYMETKNIPGIISCQNAALALPLVFVAIDGTTALASTGPARLSRGSADRGSVTISTSICSGQSACEIRGLS